MPIWTRSRMANGSRSSTTSSRPAGSCVQLAALFRISRWQWHLKSHRGIEEGLSTFLGSKHLAGQIQYLTASLRSSSSRDCTRSTRCLWIACLKATLFIRTKQTVRLVLLRLEASFAAENGGCQGAGDLQLEREARSSAT